MPASEAQKKNLELARTERNKHQALLKEIELLTERLTSIEAVWHDQGFSFTKYGAQLQTLKNSWPALYKKLTEEFGEAKPHRK